ncbi:DinB family protein [Cyclobacterium jeungdonense]|uniref:DinB family protein n=1 Tax=Cyclobacterium jeungdonense TaxID=708087 RepID=A0ABT8C2Y9_9BACT|nr:DinB family protein [Cyclobacterium jeungdonense]MDN3686870.1 DinB family protein [Cyclobacterium jeungdonense]
MNTKTQALVINPVQLKEHWQGHRSLTRRVIEAFPEKQLFHFTLGEMRPFGQMVEELIAIAGPGVKGLATGEWAKLDENLQLGEDKEKLLEVWDQTTEEIERWFPQIDPEKFEEKVIAFDQYEDKAYCTLFYFIDNEIHHRGQGYVYLRALGIVPPNFWER